MTIPDPQKNKSKTRITSTEALNLNQKDIETETFIVSFKHYNDNECQIKELKQSPARKALNSLKTIGRLSNVGQFFPKNIQISPVSNAGNYRKLFKTIPDEQDIDMFEYIIGKIERIFFFIVSRTFYLVTIRNSHYETNKIHR